MSAAEDQLIALSQAPTWQLDAMQRMKDKVDAYAIRIEEVRTAINAGAWEGKTAAQAAEHLRSATQNFRSMKRWAGELEQLMRNDSSDVRRKAQEALDALPSGGLPQAVADAVNRGDTHVATAYGTVAVATGPVGMFVMHQFFAGKRDKAAQEALNTLDADVLAKKLALESQLKLGFDLDEPKEVSVDDNTTSDETDTGGRRGPEDTGGPGVNGPRGPVTWTPPVPPPPPVFVDPPRREDDFIVPECGPPTGPPDFTEWPDTDDPETDGPETDGPRRPEDNTDKPHGPSVDSDLNGSLQPGIGSAGLGGAALAAGSKLAGGSGLGGAGLGGGVGGVGMLGGAGAGGAGLRGVTAGAGGGAGGATGGAAGASSGAGARGGRPGGMMMGGGGGGGAGSDKQGRSGGLGYIAPKLEDEDEGGPAANASRGGSRG